MESPFSAHEEPTGSSATCLYLVTGGSLSSSAREARFTIYVPVTSAEGSKSSLPLQDRDFRFWQRVSYIKDHQKLNLNDHFQSLVVSCFLPGLAMFEICDACWGTVLQLRQKCHRNLRKEESQCKTGVQFKTIELARLSPCVWSGKQATIYPVLYVAVIDFRTHSQRTLQWKLFWHIHPEWYHAGVDEPWRPE